MTPYSIQCGNIGESLLRDFDRVKDFMTGLPDPTAEQPHTKRYNGKYLWSCHGLTRGVRPFLENTWRVVDGYFMRRGNEHSWLILPGEYAMIMDVYPIASAGPLMVVANNMYSPWSDCYFEESIRYGSSRIIAFEREGEDAGKCYQRHVG